MANAIFLDRDGTLTYDGGYTYRVDDLRLLDNVVPALRLLMALNYRLIVVSNQSGVARGMFSEGEMGAFNRALVERLEAAGVKLDGIYSCPFHPHATVERYRCDSPLRKPNPGMLQVAAAEHGLDLAKSFMVGDKKSDVLAGKRAGCRTILVETGAAGSGEPELEVEADFIANDLLMAAQIVAREAALPASKCSA
jgi:D-glycero-D-manno-heptose 1,7-bisphosphate phosphatase